MDWIDTITKTLFVMIILWILYSKNTFSYIMDIFLSPIYWSTLENVSFGGLWLWKLFL